MKIIIIRTVKLIITIAHDAKAKQNLSVFSLKRRCLRVGLNKALCINEKQQAVVRLFCLKSLTLENFL